MDDNVHIAHFWRIFDAFITADKDVDMLLLPNKGHTGPGMGRYYWRRHWEYFVRHLIGVEPPTRYHIQDNGGLPA